MVVKSQIKLIKSLHQKKYRNLHGLFLVEGIKTVRELLDSGLGVYGIFTTDDSVLEGRHDSQILISESELKQMSSLKTPNTILGVFYKPQTREVDFRDWILALDNVSDPGNLGTIIRLCDWYGISHLVCSKDTVDCYNPKVLQATMGSIARVQVIYTDLLQFLRESKQQIFGAFMDGQSVYGVKLPDSGILVMGNEAHGISQEIKAVCHKKIGIPQFGKLTAESLNVATATAVLLNELRREN
ncbi:TrmH family RNA methyltransferase [Ulvibacterium marinum]|uniref:TrmH family RNA methyltransferase n=1 Tax=Ulvibacterium marinum TaxID=2419782 RepID=UPI002494F7EF|nr:RNA methyltransferase [Ulvibacterium marinum]